LINLLTCVTDISYNERMINWLRLKLRGFVFPETEHSNSINLPKSLTLSKRDAVGLDDERHDPIRFTVYNANGGKVLETRTYDKRTDQWLSSLHVIDSSENFGEAVGKIVFMEMLKKG